MCDQQYIPQYDSPSRYNDQNFATYSYKQDQQNQLNYIYSSIQSSPLHSKIQVDKKEDLLTTPTKINQNKKYPISPSTVMNSQMLLNIPYLQQDLYSFNNSPSKGNNTYSLLLQQQQQQQQQPQTQTQQPITSSPFVNNISSLKNLPLEPIPTNVININETTPTTVTTSTVNEKNISTQTSSINTKSVSINDEKNDQITSLHSPKIQLSDQQNNIDPPQITLNSIITSSISPENTNVDNVSSLNTNSENISNNIISSNTIHSAITSVLTDQEKNINKKEKEKENNLLSTTTQTTPPTTNISTNNSNIFQTINNLNIMNGNICNTTSNNNIGIMTNTMNNPVQDSLSNIYSRKITSLENAFTEIRGTIQKLINNRIQERITELEKAAYGFRLLFNIIPKWISSLERQLNSNGKNIKDIKSTVNEMKENMENIKICYKKVEKQNG